MEPMNLPPGYLLPEGKTMRDVLRSDEELLASEGLDASATFGDASDQTAEPPSAD
jgi:hypothetical protein